MTDTAVKTVVELKKLVSICSRMATALEHIDKSLSQGDLQQEMRYFLRQFKPELTESHALRMCEESRQSHQSDLAKAKKKAEANVSADKTSVPTPIN